MILSDRKRPSPGKCRKRGVGYLTDLSDKELRPVQNAAAFIAADTDFGEGRGQDRRGRLGKEFHCIPPDIDRR